jgi:hypothetical protein
MSNAMPEGLGGRKGGRPEGGGGDDDIEMLRPYQYSHLEPY